MCGACSASRAVSIGDALFATVGAIYFWRRMQVNERATLLAIGKIFAVAAVAGGTSYVCAVFLQNYPPFVQVFVGGTAGVLLFGTLAFLFQLPETRAVRDFLWAKLNPVPSTGV